MSEAKLSRGMRVSVVINTYNRAASLRHTLHALRHQTYADFEVVVVNGPSTDDTAKVVAEFEDARLAHCPEVHLSKSRNVGIDAAAGDVVAFIDDDALAEPDWLEGLVAAYDSDKVGGAGGVVFDHTGFHFQYQYSVCDRLGNTRFDVKPPFDRHVAPGADPFVYLQGTNASFRRDRLVEIGGFDEEIEYYMDEVDVCRRIIDAGSVIRPLPGAAVHHKYLASHRRNHKKVVFEPYPNVKNHCYLAILNNLDRRPLDELRAILRRFADGVRAAGMAFHGAGKFTDAQRDHFLAQVERGLAVGIERGLAGKRLHRAFAPADEGPFRPFRVLKPNGGRLRVCFVSQEYPPGDFGGIGRFTADLATGFAAAGHEVHVVTRSPDVNRIDFEEGVWLHRLAAPERCIAELDGAPLGGNLFHSANVYHEVRRLHERRPLDVLSAPLWACEGMACALDDRFPTVLTLMTSMKTVAGLHPSWAGADWVTQLLALEKRTVRTAQYLHPISNAILKGVQADYGPARGRAEVQPLGVRDRRAQYPTRRAGADSKVKVLFVGRLERRKGVDVLLQAAVRLLARFPDAEFILAGKDTPNTETGTTYRAQFEKEHGGGPAVADRVTFAGAVTEERLYQLYADADVVCMPSRYESFGLVLVEGMMFGKPVVGCAVGGMVEIVEVGGNGLLATPGDADSLTDCLGKLLADADLRRRYGERSRRLFEEKFALPIVIENTARFYGDVAADHARDRGRATGDGAVPRLAEVLAQVTGLAPERAGRAARALLDPSCFPTDYLAAVRRLWGLPDREFLLALYPLLLNRDPDDAGLAHYLAVLAGGTSREDVVRCLARSDEARQAGRPVAWLEGLGGASASAGPPPSGPLGLLRRVARKLLGRAYPGGIAMNGSPPRGLVGRILRKLRRAASPRNLVRYVKRSVFLPWNFQKLYDASFNLHEMLLRQTETLDRVHTAVLAHLTNFTREVQEKQALMELNLRGTAAQVLQQAADMEQRLAWLAQGMEQRLALEMAQVTQAAQALKEDGRDCVTRMQYEVRQLKHRYAELYGALVEEAKRQGRLTEEVARSLQEVRQLLAAQAEAANWLARKAS